MKYLLLLLWLPLCTSAQTDTSVIYRQSYTVKGWNSGIVNEYSLRFIKEQRANFFYLSSYSKQGIDKSIDTSGYGIHKTDNGVVIANCVFVYIAKSIDVVYGDIVFTGKNNIAEMKLQNVRYSKYEKQNGGWRETQRGLYKDLKLCRHCNVTGIKIAETVNKGFVRLSLAYEAYLKRAVKN